MLDKSYICCGIMLDMDDNFSNWLILELDKKKWSQADLARSAGVTRTTISDVISGKANAGFDACVGIAKALKLPPEYVLRVAGLLPKVPEKGLEEEQLLFMFRQMGDDQKKRVLDYAKFQLS